METNFEAALRRTVRLEAEQRATRAAAERAELDAARRRKRGAPEPRKVVASPAPRLLAEFEALVATIAEQSKTTTEQVWGFFAWGTELPELDQRAIAIVVVELNLTGRVQRTLQVLADDREERRKTNG